MSLQSMPIFDALTAPNAKYYTGLPGDSGRAMPVRGGMLSDLHKAVRFDAQVGSDAYWLVDKEVWDIRADVPPMKLPYDSVWMEWAKPAVWRSEGKDVENPLGETRQAMLAIASKPDPKHSHPEAASMLMCVPFWKIGGKILQFPMVDFIDLREDGTAVGLPRYGTALSKEMSEGIHLDLKPAFLALGFINCKNVTTEKVERSNIRSRSSNPKLRKRTPKLDYHTIVLPGGSGGGSGTGENAGTVARHKVRGHFKTFTQDAPLLGKHTGTYWWGWQVRGNKANGITVTDYKVGAAA